MATAAPITDLIAELDWRGLIHQCTDLEGLREHLASGERSIYAGFDPTADSLTIGNLVPIMALAHVKRAGHKAIVVMGGGTGLIGDPSGKSAERTLMTPETVERHIGKQRGIFERVLGNVEGGPDYTIVNNAEWLSKISYIEALRDIGKHFSVNMMMQKESVKSRLEGREQGISYTEFSYMILQAYDFLRLHDDRGVTVQVGGSDQYGNIVAGSDLIRRARTYSPGPDGGGGEPDAAAGSSEGVFGLTFPLVEKADGGKFGKTESGAIWLTGARTSPYAYFQFWLNASDDDARSWIKIFTFLSEPECDDLIRAHAEAPGKRELQRTLAREATAILHGSAAAERAEAAGKALFSGEVGGLDEATLAEVFAAVPTVELERAKLAGEGLDPVELLIASGLAKSNREAREFLGNGSVSLNGEKIGPDDRVTESRLLHGRSIAVRRGKKTWAMTRWV
ncbi:MAG: tyrosine--tRNA ligase [Planctomycetota bacterium]